MSMMPARSSPATVPGDPEAKIKPDPAIRPAAFVVLCMSPTVAATKEHA
jgi:hypothetical protein